MSATKYDMLPSESAHNGDVELAMPVAGQFTLRILFKEQVHVIQNDELDVNSTIASLKRSIQTVCSISPNQQRLIFSGRLLKPDDKQLSHFKITSGSSIHLFPIPEIISVTTTTNQAVDGVQREGVQETTMNPLAFTLDRLRPREVVLPVHFDYEVSRNARDVKMWSFVLVFLSTMTLINNLSLMLSSSKSIYG